VPALSGLRAAIASAIGTRKPKHSRASRSARTAARTSPERSAKLSSWTALGLPERAPPLRPARPEHEGDEWDERVTRTGSDDDLGT